MTHVNINVLRNDVFGMAVLETVAWFEVWPWERWVVFCLRSFPHSPGWRHPLRRTLISPRRPPRSLMSDATLLRSAWRSLQRHTYLASSSFALSRLHTPHLLNGTTTCGMCHGAWELGSLGKPLRFTKIIQFRLLFPILKFFVRLLPGSYLLCF